MPLTFEQVAQLAPDHKSLAAARQSMSLRLWSELGLSSEAVWGRCQGSMVYEVAVDLKNFAYRCSCPSRKRPCRHVLGLLFLFSAQPDAIPDGVPPGPVEEWLEKRRLREQQQKTPPQPAAPFKPADLEGQQKRVARREDRIEQGIAQLERWLCDLVRNGLAGVEALGTSLWEDQARRLVDAQAGGLANQIRAIGEIPSASRDWPQRLLFAMGQLELLLEAHSRLAELPGDLQADVRQLIGWTVSPQELETGERVTDEWIIIGQREEEDDRLRVQRTWLLGRQSQRSALILQFAPGTQPFSEIFLPGTVHLATLLFYPGSIRQRARQVDCTEVVQFQGKLSGQESLDELLDKFADQLSVQPWLTRAAFVLKRGTISLFQNSWFLRDCLGAGVPLAHPEPWRLLAETGGRPVDFVIEWNGHTALPLAVLDEETDRLLRV